MYECFSADIVTALRLDCLCLCHEVANLFLWEAAVVRLEVLGIDVFTEILHVFYGLLGAVPDGFRMETSAEE